MAKLKWHKIEIEMLDEQVCVAFVPNMDQLTIEVDNNSYDPLNGEAEGVFFYDKKEVKCLIFSLEDMSDRLIVHETFHATVHTLHDIEQEFDIDNHEVYARLADYLYHEVKKLWEKELKKTK